MEIPSYTITNLTVGYLIKFEVALQKIKSTPIPYSYKAELDAKLQADDIQSLSELVGHSIGYDQAEKVQQGRVLPSAKKRLMIFTNYRSAMEFARSYNKDHFIPPSTELIAHINTLIMSKILEEWECGRIRAFSESPNEIYDTWAGLRDYYPDLNMPRYFEEISRWVVKRGENTHMLIKLGILLYNMIDKAPFVGGNQISAITLISILAKDSGYNPSCNFSFMKALNFLDDDFKGAFKLSKSSRDLTVFLEVFLYAISLEMLNLEDKYTTTFEQKVKQQGKLASKFNSRQLKALEYLDTVDKITRNEYRKMMGISFMTAYRDLQHLVDEKFIKINGSGRGTFYTLIKKDVGNEKKPELEVFGEQ